MHKSYASLSCALLAALALTGCFDSSSGAPSVDSQVSESAQAQSSAPAASDSSSAKDDKKADDGTVKATLPVDSVKEVPLKDGRPIEDADSDEEKESEKAESEFDETSRVIMQLDDKEFAAFSLTPTKQDAKYVALKAVPLAAGNTPAEKDSLVFYINDEPHAYSVAKGRTYDYVVDKELLESLSDPDSEVRIALFVEEDVYFEGSYSAGEKNTFRQTLEKFMD